MNRSATATNCEGEHEHHDLSSTVQGSAGQEVVLSEPSWSVLAEVVLREDGEEESGEYGRVDTDGEISEGPAEDGSDDTVGF